MFVFVHNLNGLDILPTDVETLVDETLGMLGVFVSLGHLELILT